MKKIKKIVLCLVLSLAFAISTPDYAQAAACLHKDRYIDNGLVETQTCVYYNYTKATCVHCGAQVHYSLVGDPIIRHTMTSTTSRYKTSAGKTVTVVKHKCTKCSYSYTTTSTS